VLTLNKKIIMSGQGNNFELWDEHTWHEQLANLDALRLNCAPHETFSDVVGVFDSKPLHLK
jgi:DNA-binding transcriptional regulator/RsmH inhibitor MraZ